MEQSKRVKTLLDLGNNKAANHFSQSARGLSKRAPLQEPPSSQSALDKRTVFRPKSAATAMVASPLSVPSVLEGHHDGDKELGSQNSDNKEKNVAAEDYDDAHDASVPASPSRLFTFAEPSTATFRRINSTTSIISPFSSRAILMKGPSFKSANSAVKRLGRTQSLLRQTVLLPPLKPRPQPLSTSSVTSTSGSVDTPSSPEAEAVSDEVKQDGREGSDNEKSVSALANLITPAVAACTAAMTSLSPPSAKTYSAVHLLTRRPKRPLFMESENDDLLENPSATATATTTTTASNSLPLLDTAVHFLSEMSDDEDDDEESAHTGAQTTLTSISASPQLISMAAIARPTGLRRHQTMISSRSEFMRTLEISGSRRGTSLYSILGHNRISSGNNKKPAVFAPANYVPDPNREDCQILPCERFDPKPDDTTKRISPETVVDVLEGKYKDQYDLLHIIDCRFPYEFEGGHIKSAVNVNTTDELEELLLQPAITDKRVLLIFHCEFSSERGPRMARHLRNQDRAANASHYPAVFYPEVYVMKGGYSGFFKQNKSYCWPEAYIEMQDEKHSQEFETHRRTFQREFSRTASKGFLGMESNKLSSVAASSTSAASSLSGISATTSNATSDSTSSTVIVSTSPTNSATETTTVNLVITARDDSSGSLTTLAPKENKPSALTNVLSSFKEAALSGIGPSSLSLPLSSKRSTLGLSSSGKLAIIDSPSPSRSPSTLSQYIFKDMTCATSSPTKTNTTTLNTNSSSSVGPRPFFSGFRQTKPVFGAMSPVKKGKHIL
ncbi:cell division cycle- protein [Mortierella sp. GBA30]|nr:cell division cycle- protein [Mortierella sp. GBA30]